MGNDRWSATRKLYVDELSAIRRSALSPAAAQASEILEFSPTSLSWFESTFLTIDPEMAPTSTNSASCV